MDTDVVCLTCGVAVAKARSGKWVHVDAMPRGFDMHDVDPGTPEKYGEHRAGTDARAELDGARQRVADIRASMADPAREGMAWTQLAKDSVALLNEVEHLESLVGPTYGEPA